MATLCLSKPGGVEHSYGVAAVSKSLQILWHIIFLNRLVYVKAHWALQAF